MGRFPRVRLREGYHAADVDEFIDQVEAALAGRPDGQPVTAEDVRTVMFRTVRMGQWLRRASSRRRARSAGARPPVRAKKAEQNSHAQLAAPAPAAPPVAAPPSTSTVTPLHHIEIWTAHLWSGVERWGWLLGELG